MEDAGKEVMIYLWDNYIQSVTHLAVPSCVYM